MSDICRKPAQQGRSCIKPRGHRGACYAGTLEENPNPAKAVQPPPSLAEQAGELARQSLIDDLFAIEALMQRLASHPDWHSQNYYQEKIDRLRLYTQQPPYEYPRWARTRELVRAAWQAEINLWCIKETAWQLFGDVTP